MTTATLPVTTDTAPVTVQRRLRPREKRRSTVLSVALWLCAAYFLIPLVWLAIASTKNNSGLFSTFGLWFAHDVKLLANLKDVFTAGGGIFWVWIRNTVIYAGVSAVGASLVSTLAGYAFAKYDFPGKKLIFSVILGSIMIPMTALAVPTFLLFTQFRLTDTPFAVILPSLISPFSVYLMRVYAEEAVPTALIEAARIDGAGETAIFWRVAVSQLTPGLVTVFLFALVSTWNNYFLPLIMLNSTNLFPLTVGLAQWQATAAAGPGHRRCSPR